MLQGFRVEPTPQTTARLRSITRALRDLENKNKVRGELRSALRTAATPALQSARASIRAMPSKRTGRAAQLRPRIARNLRIQMRLSGDPTVRVVISRKAMGDKGNLPRRINYGAWKHPVPHAKRDVIQVGKRAWFDKPMKDATPTVQREILAVALRYEKRLFGA